MKKSIKDHSKNPITWVLGFLIANTSINVAGINLTGGGDKATGSKIEQGDLREVRREFKDADFETEQRMRERNRNTNLRINDCQDGQADLKRALNDKLDDGLDLNRETLQRVKNLERKLKDNNLISNN